MEPPSGRQVAIRHGTQQAVVVEVGGGLREYNVDRRAVVDGYPVDKMVDGSRGQPLLPWPNRLADGQYEFAGQVMHLPIDEVARHSAIHGLTRWLSWRVVEQADDRVQLGVVLHPRPGYPFTLELDIHYALGPSGLSVRTSARNVGDQALPFGAGQHPYLSVGTPLIDSAKLQFVARQRLEVDPDRLIPTGVLLNNVGSEFDFAEPRAIGGLIADTCFTDLERDADGKARVVLSDPESDRLVSVWMDQHYKYVQLFSGDTLAPEHRRRGLAIEPTTCPPNAFRTQTDLTVLQPDQSIDLEWGISVGALTKG